MDKKTNNVKTIEGYRMERKNLSILCYADDAIIIADIEDI